MRLFRCSNHVQKSHFRLIGGQNEIYFITYTVFSKDSDNKPSSEASSLFDCFDKFETINSDSEFSIHEAMYKQLSYFDPATFKDIAKLDEKQFPGDVLSSI
ncbi:hypothetical protein PV328_008404 [Microctonus aethiopoides]|uniref:Uncharacterized protein n=1 Tax=Microctonus aethiopoides TaxID=144406 RepID=A0AA39FJ55_9HYME|nr:hypothetical protein PV328_008404 [Microctonus aethiopoides]